MSLSDSKPTFGALELYPPETNLSHTGNKIGQAAGFSQEERREPFDPDSCFWIDGSK